MKYKLIKADPKKVKKIFDNMGLNSPAMKELRKKYASDNDLLMDKPRPEWTENQKGKKSCKN